MIRRLLCRISWPRGPLTFFFHDIELVETYDQYSRKLRCTYCNTYFAMSDTHKVVLPWDSEIEELTRLLYNVPRTKL